MKNAAQKSPGPGQVKVEKKDLPASWKSKRELNPKRRGTLYFQLGLILAMFMTYLGLEATFQTGIPEFSGIESTEEEILMLEQIPVLNAETPVAREKKVVYNPAEIIIDDSEVVDADAIIEKEAPQFPPLPLDSIKYSDPEKADPPIILIDLVDEVPVFPGCETVEKEQRLECFNEKIQQHIRRNFSYPEEAIELGIKGKVNLSFTIDERGRVSALKLRGPSPILEKEAERIIRKLPVMIPGKQGGRPVKVPYSLPINFKIN